MCVVLLALRINVSLESRKTQGTLPFSQPISQPFILLSFVLILCVSLMLSCVIIFKIIFNQFVHRMNYFR